MNLALADYSFLDWLKFRPIAHALKLARYQIIDKRYRRRRARASEMLDTTCATPNLLITIGFEDSELIDWQSHLVRKYVPNASYIVVDNSLSDAGAESIQNVCRNHGCPYVRTPKNPWVHAPSRSHGLALNWAWENVVKPRRPTAFGFIDADIFPLEKTDPFEPLQRQDFYGIVRHIPPRWFLWAGFCMFRFAPVERLPLDFGQAWFLGLDTGGANWNVLYRETNLSTLQHLETSFFPFREGIPLSDGAMQKCGPWIHEVGQMTRPDLALSKRAALRRIIEPKLNG